MKTTHKILIGGQALVKLGSSRSTNDTDYLIFLEDNFDMFIHDKENNIDYINGNSSNFFEAIWNREKNNDIASPESLFELKAYALLQHYRLGNAMKVNDCVYDLNFLRIKFGINTAPILWKQVSQAEKELILDAIK